VRKEIYLQNLMAKKMGNTRARTISNFKMKLGTLFRIIFGKILVFEKTVVFEKTLSKVCFEMGNKAKVDVRLAQSEDILKLVKKFKKFRGGKAEERLRARHLCFIAQKNGDIVHYKWVSFNETYVDELERKIRTGSDSAYIYDAYTVPECRGLGISGKVSTRVFDYLFQKGIKKTYHLISHNNFPSLRYAEKTGLRNMGEVTLTRSFKSRIYRCKGKTQKDYKKIKEMFSI